ncbi:hypothetical protein KQI84_02190 [bacterium]|nr:hypothetical protein [bacterium]
MWFRPSSPFMVLCTLILAGSLAGAPAEPFPRDHRPDGPHPRLWLTAERLATLQAARTADTPEWQRFQADCDTYMVEEPWNGPQYAVPHLLLIYKLTGNAAYGQKAIDYTLATRTIPLEGNDPAHGGYHAIAMTYDWLHDDPLLTTETRDALASKMVQWSDHVWATDNESGLGGNAADTDHVIMTGAVHLMMGCAMDGESSASLVLLDRAWWLWSRGQGADEAEPGAGPQSIRDWVRETSGGHFPTGYSYFSGTDAVGLSEYWLTMKTACDYDINVQEPDLAGFWPGVARTMVDATNPPMDLIHHTGDWEDPPTLAVLPWMYQLAAFAQYLSLDAGNSNMASLAQWYYDTITSDHYSTFIEFFLSNPVAVVAKSPTDLNLNPIQFCNGPDWLFFRSDWSTSATWGMFAGDGNLPVDHQSPDHGHFTLWRDGEYLTKDARAYIGLPYQAGIFFSNLSIQNASPNGTAAWGDRAAPAAIDRTLIGSGATPFAYARMQADGQWNQHPDVWEAVSRVQTYRRHFFWAGDYVVVFDRLRTSDAGWSSYRLRTLTQPQVNGKDFTALSPSGNQRLLHRTMEPSIATLSVVDETAEWNGVYEDWEVALDERKWQVEVRPADSASVDYLNVIQMGPAAMTDFDTIEHLTGNGNSGARIGSWCVVFASDETTRTLATYSVANPSTAMDHLVADLAPGTYSLKVDDQASGKIAVTAASESAHFATTAASGAPSQSIRLELDQPGPSTPLGGWLLR